MNTRVFLLAVAVVATFGIAELIGPASMTERTAAQNTIADNVTTMGGSSNITTGNTTGSNWTK